MCPEQTGKYHTHTHTVARRTSGNTLRSMGAEGEVKEGLAERWEDGQESMTVAAGGGYKQGRVTGTPGTGDALYSVKHKHCKWVQADFLLQR